ncbi:uncharacterized protein LOC135209391 [Macrobrachium nipponense]|uniref:uncharacterized protein LOC135209391 n=1 Tax=Macrobrachium nipponense TaxID=159736 RepID=UPI0030C7E0E1
MKYPCGNCRSNCGRNSIECSAWLHWIHRLNKVPRSSKQELMDAARSESLLLETYKISLPAWSKREPGNVTGTPDTVAVGVLQLLHPVVLDTHVPLSVIGDGNCLYRAVSRALYNTEEHHLLIRLKAALEIAMYPSYYDVEDPHYVDQVKDDRLLHDTYDGLLSSAATPGVPAAGKTCMADSCTADGSQADCCDVQVQVSFADSNDRDNSSSHCIEEGTCKNSVAENEAVSFRENSLADDTTDRSSDDTEESSDATPAGCIAEGGKELPIGPHAAPAFLAIDDCVTLIRSTNKDQVTDYVPRGTKENRYYLVKNTDNLKRRDEGKMSQFWDDCGTWAKGGPTTKTLYLCLPLKNLQKVVLKNEVYCWERTKQKKTVYIPLEPQPDDDHVLVVHRRYVKHSLSSLYEKRVTWLEVQNNELDIAIYEYKGTFPGRAPHKQSHGQSEYIRTKPCIINTIKEKATTTKAKDIYNDCDIINGPRNVKQVRDIIYQNKKEKNPTSTKQTTFADQMTLLEDLQVTTPFIQKICRHHGKVPCAILYNAEQIADLKRFCCTSGALTTVLGVDKTYNLGELHVTATVFKNLAVRRRSTDDHPIMAGPIFLHGNSDTDTYFVFFQHLAGMLVDTDVHPVLGSDEEKAIRLAFQKAFPGASMICCTRHLRNNVNEFLKDKSGCNNATRKIITAKIFGEEGIVAADDDLSWEMKVEDCKKLITDQTPSFLSTLILALSHS